MAAAFLLSTGLDIIHLLGITKTPKSFPKAQESAEIFRSEAAERWTERWTEPVTSVAKNNSSL